MTGVDPVVVDPRLTRLTEGGLRPALVVVDVQRDFGDPARIAPYGLDDDAFEAVDAAVTRVARLVDEARELDVPVVWVELGSDPRSPWRSSTWLRGGELDAPMPDDEPCVVGTEGADWYRMTPRADEIRVVKAGYSGFLGTDLRQQLTQARVGWVTVVGLTSECCVFATAQDAMQIGWPVVIPRDATAAYDLSVHQSALTMLGLNVGVVCESSDVVAIWTASTTAVDVEESVVVTDPVVAR